MDRFRERGIEQHMGLEMSEFVRLVEKLWSEGKFEPTVKEFRYKIAIDVSSRVTGDSRRQIWIIVDKSSGCSLTLVTVYPKDVSSPS